MTLVMFDAIDDSQYPPAGPGVCFAGYVDGSLGDQPDYGWLVKNRPGSPLLSIALSPAGNADALDIENGAAAPGSAAAWYERQKARGLARPCFYANASTMQASVVPVMKAAGIARPGVRLWTAHYGLGEHICGPGSCGQLSIDADGTQWRPDAMGRALDQSLLLDNFFAVPAPADWTFSPVRGLAVLNVGPSSVRLSWDSPGAPAPAGVGKYQVTIRRGGKDLPSYPRFIPKSANPESVAFGSLPHGTPLAALVRAMTADDGHASPWATIEFETPQG